LTSPIVFVITSPSGIWDAVPYYLPHCLVSERIVPLGVTLSCCVYVHRAAKLLRST